MVVIRRSALLSRDKALLFVDKGPYLLIEKIRTVILRSALLPEIRLSYLEIRDLILR